MVTLIVKNLKEVDKSIHKEIETICKEKENYFKELFKKYDKNLTFEVILIILRTIATIAITAALLNKQSEVELEKEQNVKIFDLKSDLYFELIDFLKNVINKEEINKKDLLSLEFLTHKYQQLPALVF